MEPIVYNQYSSLIAVNPALSGEICIAKNKFYSLFMFVIHDKQYVVLSGVHDTKYLCSISKIHNIYVCYQCNAIVWFNML